MSFFLTAVTAVKLQSKQEFENGLKIQIRDSFEFMSLFYTKILEPRAEMPSVVLLLLHTGLVLRHKDIFHAVLQALNSFAKC